MFKVLQWYFVHDNAAYQKQTVTILEITTKTFVYIHIILKKQTSQTGQYS